jgi:hypothetical protein
VLHSNAKADVSKTHLARNVSNRHGKHGKGHMKTSDSQKIEPTQEAASQSEDSK